LFVAFVIRKKQTIKPTKLMSTTKNRVIEPYLFFNGLCEEAVNFYQKALGAEVQMMMRYKESPEPPPPGQTPPDWGDKVMHASFTIGETMVMASDGCSEEVSFEGFSLSISVPDEADADRVFAALSEGGEVRMPLNKTFWSPRFGMLQDKFGVGWMIGVLPADA
jgi:PhnB protein